MCSSCLKVVPIANAADYAYTIPIQEFSSTSSRCKFQVMYCTSKDKVNEVLKPLNIKVTSMEGMKKLADEYDSGKTMADYNVDIWKLLTKIEFTPEEKANTECNLACTY